MSKPPPVYLASYPRSGNTMLRTILFHCFGLPSGSVYPNDLKGNTELGRVIGHIEQNRDGSITFPEYAVPLIKTHKPPPGPEAAIYIVRNGLEATLSLAHWQPLFSIEQIITGGTPLGTWSGHITAWAPHERPDTLLLRYEEVTRDLSATIAAIAAFLDREPIRLRIPPRDQMADGRWVRRAREVEEDVDPEIRDLFEAYNGAMMRALGYWT